MFPVRKVAQVIVSRLHPADDHPEDEGGDSGGDLEALAGAFQDAVKSGAAADVADAFKAMFAHCESEPHDESDYD